MPAATPDHVTISVGGPPATWTGNVTGFAPEVEGILTPSPVCPAGVPGSYCDSVDVTLNAPESVAQSSNITMTVTLTWKGNVSALVSALDIFLLGPDGSEITSVFAAPSPAVITASELKPGEYRIEVDADPTEPNLSYDGKVSAVALPKAAAVSLALPQPEDPQFLAFSPPDQARDILQRPNAGEPTIGANWKTGAIMYMGGTQVWRVAFDDSKSPSRVTWTDVTAPQNGIISEDSILFTDRVTGRTFAGELALACNIMAFTDDDGATWSASEGCGPPMGEDHETFGGGPYAAGGSSTNDYPHAVYMCSQFNIDASCTISHDGGFTFQSPPTRVWGGDCSPIHGHIRVGPDGYAYLPNNSCAGGHVGVAVSADNDQTWTVHTVPDSVSAEGVAQDPSVDIGPDNTAYFGYTDGTGHPKIAVSHDHGGHWSRSIDVGKIRDPKGTEDGLRRGIQNVEFAEVIAGDAGRAAFAFLGTGTAGDTQSQDFPGVWYVFISYTYNGGKSWRTVNATPNNPVQRGCISNGGFGPPNPCRNLLDFNDITVDNHGRVLVSYTDGCTTDPNYSCDKTKKVDRSGCVASEGADPYSTKNCTYGRLSALVRQSCGRGLVAAYDTKMAHSCSSTIAPARAPKVLAEKKTRGGRLAATGENDRQAIATGLLFILGATLVGRRLVLTR